MDQRLRLAQLENEKNYKTKKRKITEYEIKRLKEIKFLTESENEYGVVNQDGFLHKQTLIQ
jgi:hypothetical protein